MQNISAPRKPAGTPAHGNVGEFVQGKADQVLGNKTDTGRGVQADANRDANAAPQATDKKEIARQQTEFVDKLKNAGIQAHNPPTQEELKKYFSSFNSADKRGKALEEYENYTRAFHVHTAEVKGHEKDDIKYSAEKTYVYKGQMYDSKKEAQAAAKAAGDKSPTINWVNSADADKWSDVNGKPAHNGRKIQDCEGYAYMSKELLGAAGYEVTYSSNKGAEGGHAMTVVKDPASGKIYATSNDKVVAGDTQKEALTKGWNYATNNSGSDPGTFYTGDTLAHAQTAKVIAEQGW